jgi:AsmA protein
MRIVRVVAIAVGAFVALIVVAIVALLVFVDPNRYRGDIEKMAHDHTARTLEIHGKIRLKVFPWIALGVSDVQLSNRPGFGTEPFMTVQSASIGVGVLPLLGGHLEVSKVSLEGVHLNLVSRGEQNNWQDLGESEEAKAAPPKPTGSNASASSSPGSLSIEGVDLSESSLVYRDDVKKSTTEIAGLELHTGTLETGPDRTAVGKLELQGTYLARTDSPTAGGGAGGGGDLKPIAFSLSSAGLAMDSSHALAPSKVELKFGDSALLISLSGERMSTEPLVSGTVTIPTTSPRKLMQSLGIAPPVTRDGNALSALGLQTNFRLAHRQLQLSALQLTLDDTRVQGTAADDLDRQAVSFDLTVNAINLDRYRAPVQKGAARTPTPAQPPTPLPLEALRKLNVHGSLRVGSATVSNLQLTDLVVPLAAQDGHIRIGPTQAHLYGGSCNGDIGLDAGPAQAQLSLDQHVHGTDVGALVKAMFESARLSGHADLNVAMTGTGNTDDALTRSLSGKIDANAKQGALNGIDIVYELQRVNALLKREVPPQRTGPARTVFNTLQTNGTLDKGMLHIDELKMETDFLKVHGGGTLDTVTEAINYQLAVSVNKLQANANPAGEAGSGLDALKSVEVPLQITGTLASPTVRPDIEALAKGKLGQEVKQQAVEQVKKKLGDKLKDLFGH